MKRIYKYPISGKGEVCLPRGANILKVALQGSVRTIWALVDVDEKEVTECLVWEYGTGAGANLRDKAYLETIFEDGYVWHLFIENVNKNNDPLEIG